jgi:predicted alpha/beta hydrolase
VDFLNGFVVTRTLLHNRPVTIGTEHERLLTDDGVSLGATRYRPATPPIAGIVVAGATAVPRGFYRRFAEHAARAGFEVLTLDYRGTGESRPKSLRGYRMGFGDWAEHDIPAAIGAMDPSLPLHLVGHSYGGSALGLVPGLERLTSAYTFGSGSGWAGWMSRTERVRLWFIWNLIGPVSVGLLGYLPWSRLGSGEDLPSGAFWGWRRWTGFRRFVVDDPLVPDAATRYAAVLIPLTYAVATDDPWATPPSRDAMLGAFTGAASRTALDLAPASIGATSIGHMGYFRAGSEPLWDAALESFRRV